MEWEMPMEMVEDDKDGSANATSESSGRDAKNIPLVVGQNHPNNLATSSEMYSVESPSFDDGSRIESSTVIENENDGADSDYNYDEDEDLILNDLDQNSDDPDAVALLQQIFPDDSIATLRELHETRCGTATNNSTSRSRTSTAATVVTTTAERSATLCIDTTPASSSTSPARPPAVPLPNRFYPDYPDDENDVGAVLLPPDFLRLPLDVAVRRRRSLPLHCPPTGTMNSAVDETPLRMARQRQRPLSTWRYDLVQDLSDRVMAQHERAAAYSCNTASSSYDHGHTGSVGLVSTAAGNQHHWYYVTKVVPRDCRDKMGLGMTLVADPQGHVRVQALVGTTSASASSCTSSTDDGSPWVDLIWNASGPPPRRHSPSIDQDEQRLNPTSGSINASRNGSNHNVLLPVIGAAGPALLAGVECGDVLIGIDGVAFVESIPPHEASLVQHAVTTCRAKAASTDDPVVVLHLLRYSAVLAAAAERGQESTVRSPTVDMLQGSNNASHHWTTKPSLLDTSDVISIDSVSLSPTAGNISLHSDLSGSYGPTSLNGNHVALSVQLPTHPFVKLLAETSLIQSEHEQREASNMLRHLEARSLQWDELLAFMTPTSDLFVPLHGVRKALSVRIVNAFQDGNETAYTVWVHDVDWGKEWYAPVRYLRDFMDLRAATLPLCPASIKAIPFPLSHSSRSALHNLFRSPDKVPSTQCESTCRQLEYFLRCLCAMIYKEKLHPYMAEIAIHVQSFLGCDDHNMEPPMAQFPKAINGLATVPHDRGTFETDPIVRMQLKQCIQRYTYRLLLLDALRRTIDKFVDSVRLRGPRWQDIEYWESQGRDALKAKAMADLCQIQAFLDKVQDMILEGCRDDFVVMTEHHSDYRSIYRLRGAGYWDSIVREAVREQVEIEIYVPLRSVVSRWLVNGWRHEDMEVHFRMKELSRRSPEFFRIETGPSTTPNDSAPSARRHFDWSSVSQILHDGVGLSTLPCIKLRAIVDAAREIFRILSEEASAAENTNSPMEMDPNGNNNVTSRTSRSSLGADDFLPIFIYCVVQAEMERPCALCVLLRTLCDRTSKIGEMGYYLMSFEAVIKHCEEVDLLDEEREEMPSFLSIPLDDN